MRADVEEQGQIVIATRRDQRRYNRAVSQTIFDEMKSYIGFNADDAATLKALGPVVAPSLPHVVECFYAQILRHPGARGVLGGEEQALRLRGFLLHWLETLFCGKYDERYVATRAEIGRAHVRAGLPQHYMFTALEIVRQELEQIIRESGVPEPMAGMRALCKLLAIETGLMLESYKVSYAERVRQLERSAIEERVSRVEHLAEVGQLAASLAHEIKNPLAGISGAIQVIRGGITADDPQRPILNEILHQINRLDGTVKDLLIYARPPAPRCKPVRLQDVIQRVISLLKKEPALRRVRFECADCADFPTFEADEHQIEQILMNLLLNAADATSPKEPVWLRVAADDRDVTLVVEDHGPGMAPEIARRAFEPFYTTKARGTGLGLPICQRIVDMHGGSIRIDSEVGTGTTVVVRLPRAQQDGAE